MTMSLMRKDVAKKFDKDQVGILKMAGKRAGLKAYREARELGLSIKYVEDDKVIELLPTGEKKIVNTLKRNTATPNLKKGTVLCRK